VSSDTSRYAAWCRRIIVHCLARGWYGPDDALEHGMETERYVVDGDGTLRGYPIEHDPRTGFEFAPATPEDVQATEQALGFALPPLLRAVYLQVANGGFGPGTGLTGGARRIRLWPGWPLHNTGSDRAATMGHPPN
jgi:hypothetical protein